MKKTKFFFLTLLAGLLMSVSAQAAIEDGKYYTILADFYNGTNDANRYLVDDNGNLGFQNYNTTVGVTYYWKAVADGDKFKFQSLTSPTKFLTPETGGLSTSATSYTISADGNFFHLNGYVKAKNANVNIGTWGPSRTQGTGFGNSNSSNTGCFSSTGHGHTTTWSTYYTITEVTSSDITLYVNAQTAIASGEQAYKDTQRSDKPLTTNTNQYSSNAPYADGTDGHTTWLMDGDASTHFHASWAGTYSSVSPKELYLNNLPTNVTNYRVQWMDRAGSNSGNAEKFDIYGGTVETPATPDKTAATFNRTTEKLASITLAESGHPTSGTVDFTIEAGNSALCFSCTQSSNGKAYFHLGDFRLYEIDGLDPVYTVEAKYVTALQSALSTLKASYAARTITQDQIDAVNTAVEDIKNNAQAEYTVSIVGAPSAVKITVGGKEYGDGETFKSAPIGVDDIEAPTIAKYSKKVTIEGAQITVTYTLDMSQFSYITDITNLSNSKAYYILPYDNGRGAWTYNSADAGWVNSTGKAGTQASILNTDQHFALLKSERGNYYLYSIAAGKFVSYAADESIASGDKHRAALTDTPLHKINFNASTSSYTSYPFVISLMTPDRKDLGVSNSYAHGVITFWNSTADGGNCVRIYDTEVAFDPTSALEKIAEIEANYLTDVQALAPYFDNAGAVYALTTAAKASLNSTYETLIGQEVVTKAEYTAFKADFDKAEKVALTTGYYQLKVITYDRIATSSVKGGSDATTCQSDVAGDAGSIAYINTEDGSIRLQNKYIATTGNTAGSTLSDTPCAFQFVDMGGKAAIGLPSGGQYDWLHSGAGRDYGVCSWSQSASASHWAIIPVSELAAITSFIEGEGYVGTAFMPFAYTFNALSEAKAYRVETIAGNDGYYRAQPITGTIPANCPVIIKATLNPILNIVASAEALTEENVLEGTYMGTTGAGQYGLAYQNSSLVFAPIASGTAIRRNSAYIPASLEVKGVFFDNETGIANVDANANIEGAIFNLAGQKINKLQKGVNIVNGRKVLY